MLVHNLFSGGSRSRTWRGRFSELGSTGSSLRAALSKQRDSSVFAGRVPSASIVRSKRRANWKPVGRAVRNAAGRMRNVLSGCQGSNLGDLWLGATRSL